VIPSQKAFGLVVFLTVAACADPVLEAQIAALGEESPHVLPGPLHRPGQPCLLCHSAAGPASRFTVAGTVFLTPTAEQPVAGVEVQLFDASRRWFLAYTNCAGNFFVTPQEYEPRLPLWVSLSGQGLRIDMESPMHKDGDCATCHRGKKSPTSAGHVYLTADPLQFEAAPTHACGGVRK